MKRWETAGLFLAWALHDAEEWFTVGRWSRAKGADPTTPGWLQRLPLVTHGVPDRRMHAAITAMGAIVAGATLDGLRTEGRSTCFRAAVLGFGLHGLGHLAATVAFRGYTPGIATTPITVLPYAVWALRRTSDEHGPVGVREVAVTAALLPVAFGAAHAIGAAVDRRRRT